MYVHTGTHKATQTYAGTNYQKDLKNMKTKSNKKTYWILFNKISSGNQLSNFEYIQIFKKF